LRKLSKKKRKYTEALIAGIKLFLPLTVSYTPIIIASNPIILAHPSGTSGNISVLRKVFGMASNKTPISKT
jgi:hypothetical protein